MKVVTINGSSRTSGNTATALDEISAVLNEKGIETERIQIGSDAIHGCVGCGYCAKQQNRRCVFDDDILNKNIDCFLDADGVIIGSPVYYAGINGALKCFLDRAFYVASANGALMRHKPGAGVVAVRRGGETTAWDQLNKYFTISEMFVPSSHYWNMVFGMQPGEAKQDVEGLQCMRILGENMAWLLNAVAGAGGANPLPPRTPKTPMNFIR